MKRNRLKIVTCVALFSYVLMANYSAGQTHTKKAPAKSSGVAKMITVENIAPPRPGDNYYQVLCLGLPHPYKLPAKASPVYLKELKESKDNRKPVYIIRANEQTDIIQKVYLPGKPAQKKKK